jgi:hypothetical protein
MALGAVPLAPGRTEGLDGPLRRDQDEEREPEEKKGGPKKKLFIHGIFHGWPRELKILFSIFLFGKGRRTIQLNNNFKWDFPFLQGGRAGRNPIFAPRGWRGCKATLIGQGSSLLLLSNSVGESLKDFQGKIG